MGGRGGRRRELAITLLIAASGVLINHEHSQRDAMACTPDAFRLCMSAMPSSVAVLDCLRNNKPRLSAACRAVLTPHRTHRFRAAE